MNNLIHHFLATLKRLGICFVALVSFTTCGSFGPQQPDPIKDMSGCYRVQIRNFSCGETFKCYGRWEVKNVCYNSEGNWIESNGLNIKVGKTNERFGIFSVDTIIAKKNIDTASSTRYFYVGFSHYGQDTVNTGLGFEDSKGTKFLIYDTTPSKLQCWEYILPDSFVTVMKNLDIRIPELCPKSIDEIVDSTSFWDKLN
jgi:hypothetical protein